MGRVSIFGFYFLRSIVFHNYHFTWYCLLGNTESSVVNSRWGSLVRLENVFIFSYKLCYISEKYNWIRGTESRCNAGLSPINNHGYRKYVQQATGLKYVRMAFEAMARWPEENCGWSVGPAKSDRWGWVVQKFHIPLNATPTWSTN